MEKWRYHKDKELAMKTATFEEWNLSALDKAFGLKQIWQSDLLAVWEKMPCKISTADKNSLLKLQSVLVRGGQYWNDAELKSKFISPLIMLAEIDDGTIGYFLERRYPPKLAIINYPALWTA
jgi:hypothetical protein